MTFLYFVTVVLLLTFIVLVYWAKKSSEQVAEVQKAAVNALEAIPRINPMEDERSSRAEAFDSQILLNEYLRLHQSYGSMLSLQGHNTCGGR